MPFNKPVKGIILAAQAEITVVQQKPLCQVLCIISLCKKSSLILSRLSLVSWQLLWQEDAVKFLAGCKDNYSKLKCVTMFFLLQVKIACGNSRVISTEQKLSPHNKSEPGVSKKTLITTTGSCTIFRLFNILRMRSCFIHSLNGCTGYKLTLLMLRVLCAVFTF